MPYATCPNCGDTFHLLVTKDVDQWKEKFPVAADGKIYIECYYCWKTLNEYDVVKVINLPIENINNIEEGDIGAIVMKYTDTDYEVECVNSDGTTKWLHTLPRKNLKYVSE